MPNRSAVIRLFAILAVAGSSMNLAMAQNNDGAATRGAGATQPDAKERARKLAELLEDWMHYTRIHNFELAVANAQALLDAGMTDEEFAALVDDNQRIESRFTDTVIRAQRHGEIEKLAGALLQKYERGRLAHARDAAEIARNIQMLTGTQGERSFATSRLKHAGEYAMPQLFSALLDRSDLVRQAQVRRVVVEMGRDAIIPLCTALPALEPNNQEYVVGVIGDLVSSYTTPLPFLYELRAATQSERVRTACDRAIQRIGGAVNPEIPVSTRFETLAVEYYNESPSLTAFKGEENQLLWSYDPGSGLYATPVRTEVYHEAMAMRMAERALRHSEGNTEALALWIAANFSREIQSPEGYENPAYPSSRRDATYYAVAAGSSVCERVLARALDDRNTQLARKAIAAIEKTAGANAMIASGATGRRPLLDAVSYPSRRVQYDAALAIGAAQPTTDFPGSMRIVPALASAIRDASARYAVVISPNASDQGGITERLTQKGYTVLPPARSLDEIAQQIAETPGIDLVISLQLPGPSTDLLIQQVRGRPALAATPVLAVVSLQGYLELGKKYEDDPSTKITRQGVSDDQIVAAADQLIEASVGGPISEDEAQEYKLRALSVLRDLAVSGNDVLKVSFASGPLVTALEQEAGNPVQLRIAEVLSYIGEKQAQTALMDAAMTADGDDQVALLGAVANSAKRFGNMLDTRHVNALVRLAGSADTDAQATAAAALMGALNLPNKDLIPLILNEQR